MCLHGVPCPKTCLSQNTSDRPRKLIHHDIRESGACYKGIMNHSWTLDHIQNAHTAQEKRSYAMSKVSTFSMQSLLHLYLKKTKPKKKKGTKGKFQTSSAILTPPHQNSANNVTFLIEKKKIVSLQAGWLANKPNCAGPVTPAFAQMRPRSQPSSAMDTFH